MTMAKFSREALEAVARRCSVKKEFLKILRIHHRKYQSSAWNFIKKRLWFGYFLVNFSKFLKTHLFYRTPQEAVFPAILQNSGFCNYEVSAAYS